MLREIESAANFLVELLTKQLARDQLQQFREQVIHALQQHYQKHWFPETPVKGSGFRCLRINHKMDPMLARAARRAGLPDDALRQLFPHELTLWVDPKEVSYRIGENGSICVIYEDMRQDLTPSPPLQSSSLSSSPSNSISSSTSSSPSNWFYRETTTTDFQSLNQKSFYLNSFLS